MRRGEHRDPRPRRRPFRARARRVRAQLRRARRDRGLALRDRRRPRGRRRLGRLRRPGAQRPWAEDTLVMVHSATKGAAALCAHVLVGARRARPRRAGRALLARVCRRGQGADPGAHAAESPRRARRDRALAAPARGARLESDGRRARRAGSELGARHGARLSRGHVRLAGRRGGAARSAGARSGRSSATRSRGRSGSTSGSACPPRRIRASRGSRRRLPSIRTIRSAPRCSTTTRSRGARS